MIIELDVSPRVAEAEVDSSSAAITLGAAEAVGAVIAHGPSGPELDITTQVATAEVEAPSTTVSPDASEAVGLVIAQGPPGTPGPTGPPGPTYEGVAWWYGEGPPGVIVGAKPGDFYLDTDDGTIYRLGG